MSKQHQDNAGWMCGNCKKLRAKNAWFCDLCGSAWEDCIIYPKKKTTQARSSSRRAYWTEPDHAPWTGDSGGKSPRQSPRTKNTQKNRGKGRGKSKQQPLAPPPPPPIAGPEGQQPPWMSMPLPPGASSSTASATTQSLAEQKLKDVASMLKKANPETLTPELQHFVAEETKAATKKDAKTLYTAVDELTKAREALDTALLARSNLMAQWRAFLTMSLERFRQYTDHFQQQELAHQENIKTAKEALQKAKADFSTGRGGHGHLRRRWGIQGRFHQGVGAQDLRRSQPHDRRAYRNSRSKPRRNTQRRKKERPSGRVKRKQTQPMHP